jgi:hypothetical protein
MSFWVFADSGNARMWNFIADASRSFCFLHEMQTARENKRQTVSG